NDVLDRQRQDDASLRRALLHEGNDLEDVVGIHPVVTNDRVSRLGGLPHVSEADVLCEGAGCDQFKDREFHSGSVKRLEDRADCLSWCGRRQGRDWKLILLNWSYIFVV